MTTKEYQKKSGFAIFLSFFKPHRKLFVLDIFCALMVSLIDLCYPIVSRTAMQKLLFQLSKESEGFVILQNDRKDGAAK